MAEEVIVTTTLETLVVIGVLQKQKKRDRRSIMHHVSTIYPSMQMHFFQSLASAISFVYHRQGRRSSGVQSDSVVSSTGRKSPRDGSTRSTVECLRSTANFWAIVGSNFPSMASDTIRPNTGKN